jgi:hypothetical protein
MQHLLASLAIAAPVAIGIVATPSAPSGREVFAFDDPRITEASALVVDDGLFITTNDSGHTGDVFAVDRRGSTVGVTHWSDDPVDTEALAPGGPGFVWVADIGDNTAARSWGRVGPAAGGGGGRARPPPPDAETLLQEPSSGRLYLASKNVFGGVLYAVPATLDASAPNRLKPVGRVLPVATDGAFFPDGEHVVIRNYTTAVVYEWPSLQPAGAFRLPSQRQGEGIAVAADGKVYVSSEGPRAPVLEVPLPPTVSAAIGGVSPDPASPSTRGPTTGAPDPSSTEPDVSSHDLWPWLTGGMLGVVALVVLLRALRPH